MKTRLLGLIRRFSLTALSVLTIGASQHLAAAPTPAVIIEDSLASNTYFWGLADWHNGGGSLNFDNGYLEWNSALSTYVGSYGPSGTFPWFGNYTYLPDHSPLFALDNAVQITFEARATAPNGTTGLTVELAQSYNPNILYVTTSPALSTEWTTYTLTTLNLIGTPDPTLLSGLSLTTGGTNLGVVNVRNLKIEAVAATAQAPVIINSLAVSPTIDVPFEFQLMVNYLPTTISVTGLPPGLAYDTDSRKIIGTPTVLGTSLVSISASNALGTDTKVLTINVVLPPEPAITSAGGVFVTVNTPLQYTITATQSPTSFSATGLPPGLTFDASTGVISGTPTVSGVSLVTIGATNAIGTGTDTLRIDVSYPGQIIYADSLSTNTYFYGLAGWANANNTLNFLNRYLSYSSAASPYVSTYGPSGIFPWDGGYTPLPDHSPLFAAGNSLRITFEARATAPTGVDGLKIEAATSYGPDNYYVATSPALTTEWQTFTLTSFAVVGTPDPAYLTGFAFTTGGPNLGTVNIRNVKIEALVSATAPPAITSATTAGVAVNTPFTYMITAVDSPTSYSASGLPAGLVFDPVSGTISGTPTAVGVSVITLGAANANGSASASLTLTVTAPALSPIQQWALTNFGSSDLSGNTAPDADFDSDGLSNLLEYALDTNPTTATSASVIATAVVNSKLQITFLRARAELTYEVLGSSDLANPASWQVIATNPGAVSLTTPVTVEDTESVPAAPKRFLRLRVSL